MADTVKILVLGSGMVAPPCVEYLSRTPKNEITVGV
jgi:saccharopine dehydrogenase (NADP+, L-glutamate forming)